MSSAKSVRYSKAYGGDESDDEEDFFDAPEQRELQSDVVGAKATDLPTVGTATSSTSKRTDTRSDYERFYSSETPTIVVFPSEWTSTPSATLTLNQAALTLFGGSTQTAADRIVAWRDKHPERSLNAFTDQSNIERLDNEKLFGCSWELGDWARYDGFKAEGCPDDGWVEISIPDRSYPVTSEVGSHGADKRVPSGNDSHRGQGGLMTDGGPEEGDWVFVERL